ncbi:MAG: molybdopterin molybdotransferase MoeA [Bacteroidota bacterium]
MQKWVDEASKIILDNHLVIQTESLPLHDTIGRVLMEDLFADRDFPPYDRVTMDGIAINYESFAAGQRSFKIAAIGAAGAEQLKLPHPSECIEIMTGAVLPKETDTVIRYEDLQIDQQTVHIQTDKVRQGQNIHYQGEDRTKGTKIISAGAIISPAELGVAATIGKSHLQVARMPKTMIISTGDELVEIEDQPAAHQIRKSNVHRILATLKSWGMQADFDHLNDDPEEIRQRLKEIIQEYDLVLLSGGVSKGKFDYIPDALASLKVQKLFHRVSQRPGKPFWFGRSEERGTVVFALPGNPVSSFMCTQVYLPPWLRASMGLAPSSLPYAQLAEDYHFRPDLTYFLQVKVQYQSDGSTLAYPITGHGSGDLANLVDADGFLELPKGRDVYQKGEAFRYITYR